MADPRDDDVIRPRIRVLAPLAREDRDRRSSRCLGTAVSRCHHLTEPSGHDGATTLGEKPADLLGGGFPLGSTTDDRYLASHAGSMTRWRTAQGQTLDPGADPGGRRHGIDPFGTRRGDRDIRRPRRVMPSRADTGALRPAPATSERTR